MGEGGGAAWGGDCVVRARHIALSGLQKIK
jgi:hypothetical protein